MNTPRRTTAPSGGVPGSGFRPDSLELDATNLITPEELARMLAAEEAAADSPSAAPHPSARRPGMVAQGLAPGAASSTRPLAGPCFAARPTTLFSVLDPVIEAFARETVGGFLFQIDWTGRRPAFVAPQPPAPAELDAASALPMGGEAMAGAGAGARAILTVGAFFGAVAWDGTRCDPFRAAGQQVPGLASAHETGAPGASRRDAGVPSQKSIEVSIDSVFDDFVW
jgi:hypothetical protein